MKPTRNNVIVTRIAGEKTTEYGIILKSSQEPDRARVDAVGPETTEVSVGEIALVNWNNATRIREEVYILPEDEIVLVYE